MDRNFHTDDFERLLREKSDEFRMYPSKRIWHSIYNNIHPGRKWPSVAMCITLITALFLVGYLNTKNTNLYTEADKIINLIQKHPIRARIIKGNYRAVNIPDFPFQIIYSYNKVMNRISVSALHHTSKHPKKRFRKF